MNQQCPYCESPLPDEASFCPHCAKNIRSRVPLKPPRRIPVQFLRAALLFLIASSALFAVFLYVRPKTYDGMGEVIYTDSDGVYQLLINDSMDRYTPKGRLDLATNEEPIHFPSWLYINHRDSGADAGGIFMQKVTGCEVEIRQPSDSPSPITCTTPEQRDFNAGAARVSLIDFTNKSPDQAQIVWTLHMENGDTIRIRSDLILTRVNTYNYDWEDADLSTSESLQAFLDQLAKEIPAVDVINITLPTVAYTEPVIIRGHNFSLTGTEEDGQRTAFTAGVQIQDHDFGINYFTDIDFIGNGNGIGLSAADRAWTKSCRFTGWKTVLLGYGNTWINTTDCIFEDNGIGLHYNAADASASDSHFTGNQFTGNDTAVYLERVPTDVKMDFSDCVFTDNGTDISNPCNQPINISQAVFQ